MEQNQREYSIEKENDFNYKTIDSHKAVYQSSHNCIEETNYNSEVHPRIKRQKTNNHKVLIASSRTIESTRPSHSTLHCNICRQILDGLTVYEDNVYNGVFEDVALTDEKLHLSIDGAIVDDELSPTYKLINFSIYDTRRHLCRFDTGLIEDNIPLYCAGYIVPIYEENPTIRSGVPTINIGPINEWYTTGFDGGDKVLVCISTQFAEYYLISPSEQYKPFMNPVYEKAYMSKLVIEFITTKDNPTYEDLIDQLQTVDPPEGLPRYTEESLLNNVQFICDQIASLDLNSDDSDDFPLLTTSCVRSLINLTGITLGKTIKSCQLQQKSPMKKRKKSWTSPAMTDLIREIFQRFYPQNQDSLSANNKSTGCGICEVSCKSDSGVCYICKSLEKHKNLTNASKTCIKRKCPNKAIEDAEVESGIDEDDGIISTRSTIDISKVRQPKMIQKSVRWQDQVHTKKDNREYHRCIQIGNNLIIPGNYVIINAINPASEQIAQIISMWAESDGTKKIHVNWYLRGRDTILGTIADDRELFAVNECTDISPNCVKRQITVVRLEKFHDCINSNSLNEFRTTNNIKNLDENLFYYRKHYNRENARFEDLAIHSEKADILFCPACERLADSERLLRPHIDDCNDVEIAGRVSYGVVNYRNEEYRPGNGIYISPSNAFVNDKLNVPVLIKPNLDDIDEDLYPEYYRKYFTGNHIKGSNYDTPEPFDIGYIKEIYTKTKTNKSKCVDSYQLWIKFNRMYRCEDTHKGSSIIQTADINMLYWSDEIYEIPFSKIMGKCHITYFESSDLVKSDWMIPHRFYFTQTYNASTKTFSNPPLEIIEEVSNYDKSKKKMNLNEQKKQPLKTLDIFAGCGGLSAGLIKAGVADVRWAIEKDHAAARAFQINHSQVIMYQGDCNLFLKEIISGKKQKKFPQKGDVELLCGGPPCQGFSGLNRFNSTQYSYLKNTLLFTFLSYCDYYRPKFIIMENVLNFTLQNKGMMLKIAIYCFLKMNYQCTFTILQAGNFGLPQSRRRTILLAAAPGEQLPVYPEPLHVFSKRACQLDIVLDGKKFSSNCYWKDSAPYRTICVRDAIADLPNIENGHNVQQVLYGIDAISHFQRKMRNSSHRNDYVSDHICKKMSPLVLARIQNIPKAAGADWRDLPNIVLRLSDGTLTKKLEYRYLDKKTGKNHLRKLRGVCSCAVGKPCNPLDRQENTLIPWCLPHTSNRQYGWAGTYGRLDWNGFFGTTITNPEPLGKQGRVLHPEQSRVVSVRECARSQGFPDNYCFEGTLIEKYRQIGNAVPPPLAEAIGYEIKRVI